MNVEFAWHEAKAVANLQAHDVSFELATTVFPRRRNSLSRG